MQAGAKNTLSYLLYDELCPFCVSQVRLLKRLDWRHAFEAVPMSDPRAGELIPGVSREELLEAMRCVTGEGQIHAGAGALRFLAWRIPLLVPLAVVLWVPGMIHVAEWIYRRIARNRYVLSRVLGCEGGACEIKRPDDIGTKQKSRTADARP